MRAELKQRWLLTVTRLLKSRLLFLSIWQFLICPAIIAHPFLDKTFHDKSNKEYPVVSRSHYFQITILVILFHISFDIKIFLSTYFIWHLLMGLRPTQLPNSRRNSFIVGKYKTNSTQNHCPGRVFPVFPILKITVFCLFWILCTRILLQNI